MPANLNHGYLNAEKAYRRASSLTEELECLQRMLRELPKHKGTDKLQADLKRKISKTKRAVQEAREAASTSRAKLKIPRQGAGQVVIVGAPNSGKSQLMATLTGASPEIAIYPFTTRAPMPGLMRWEDIVVQVIDSPPLVANEFHPDLQSIIRGADLVLLLGDLGSDEGAAELLEILSTVQSCKTRLGCRSTIEPGEVGVTFTETLLVWTKSDLPEAPDRLEFFLETIEEAGGERCGLIKSLQARTVSAVSSHGISDLVNAVVRSLDLVRVYTKDPRKKNPDFDKPFTVKRGTELIDVARLIHQDLAENFRSARVWGSTVHDGTIVNGDYLVNDQDVVEIQTS